MFGFGKPKCPVDPVVKDWMEFRMGWLGDRFGRDRLFEMQVVTPTNDYFPFALDGSVEAGERMFDLVCKFMDVEKGEAVFDVFDPGRMKFPAGVPYDWKHDGAAGFYEDEVYKLVAVSDELLLDAEGFVGTVAHELGHVLLIGRGLLDPDSEEDHEPLTDLLTVYFGLGLFGANASLREKQWDSLGMQGWSTAKSGYFDFPKWGYAHALLANARAEEKPGWAKYLRPDVRKHFNDGLKYLKTTGDTKFRG
jgi:hypothetical protein